MGIPKALELIASTQAASSAAHRPPTLKLAEIAVDDDVDGDAQMH